jgi:hypothetical protein
MHQHTHFNDMLLLFLYQMPESNYDDGSIFKYKMIT